jgi:hypothetical protein
MMAAQTDIAVVLLLDRIEQLFTAPDANPFSTAEVEILGQSGMECIKKRISRLWPRRPESVQVTLQVPPDQLTPGLAEQTRLAVQNYCTAKIADNRLKRGLVIQRALRQFSGALIGTLIAIVVINLLAANPFGLLPELVRNLLIVLASFAIAILIFNALWSLVFDWLPFVQDNTVHTVLMDMNLTIEPHRGGETV